MTEAEEVRGDLDAGEITRAAELARIRGYLSGQGPTWSISPTLAALVTEANTKAEALLAARLGSARLKIFLSSGTIIEPSRLWPGVIYRLKRNEPVRVIADAQEVASLCLRPGRGEPEPDRLLAILDLIQTDERHLWAMANIITRSPGRGEPEPDRLLAISDDERHLWAMTSIDIARMDPLAGRVTRSPALGPSVADDLDRPGVYVSLILVSFSASFLLATFVTWLLSA